MMRSLGFSMEGKRVLGGACRISAIKARGRVEGGACRVTLYRKVSYFRLELAARSSNYSPFLPRFPLRSVLVVPLQSSCSRRDRCLNLVSLSIERVEKGNAK